MAATTMIVNSGLKASYRAGLVRETHPADLTYLPRTNALKI